MKENGLDFVSWTVLGCVTMLTVYGVYVLFAQLIEGPYKFFAWFLASVIMGGTFILPLFMVYLNHHEKKMERLRGEHI